MANSVDPGQTPHAAASDLGLQCLHRPVCPIIIGQYGNFAERIIERTEVVWMDILFSCLSTKEVSKLDALPVILAAVINELYDKVMKTVTVKCTYIFD